MPRLRLAIALAALAACTQHITDGPPVQPGRPHPTGASVLTQHNDNTRSGWNDHETQLTTTNVNVQQFGKLFTLPVDDHLYAQPLIAGGVDMGSGPRDVVYVATVNNSVYAYDGDDGRLYWQKNFTAPGMRPPANTDMTSACNGSYTDFGGNIGIVGTPVIDAAKTTIYFVARSTNGSAFVQYLHAVDILHGTEKPGSPVAITATAPGSGDGSVGGVITFDARRANQRQALTLVNGVVYVSFASHCDWGPYHGWILGYDAASLQQRIVYNATPDGSAGGMWESGMGMAADAGGNLYVVTGNGTVGSATDPTDVTNRSESALKLTPSGATLRVASWFTPMDFKFYNDYDLDYGGPGALLIPNTTLFFTGAKDGSLYLLDRDAMGGFQTSGNAARQVLALGPSSNLHCQPAYFGGATEFVYLWSENDALRAYPFDRAAGTLDEGGQLVFTGGGPTGQNGAVLSVSSNGTTGGSGILWASYAYTGDAEHEMTPGILRAFDASDVRKELWNNHQNEARDAAGAYAKFASPTIANGRVYLPTFSHQVVVYGLR